MSQKILINVEDKDIRVAVMESGKLVQLFVEELESRSLVGNIYKGRVESIVPGLQAVFVNIGEEKNAFLHFSDMHGGYILPDRNDDKKGGGKDNRRGRGRKRQEPKADNPVDIRNGSDIIVQVTKDPLGTKGARVTTYLSLPGRYLVLLPFSSSSGGGVSRRIENESERKRLRGILRELKADEGGFIVRTAGTERDKEEIVADVQKLQKLWDRITKAEKRSKAPEILHDDHDILGRVVRDELGHDVSELIIDSQDMAQELRRQVSDMMPELKSKVTVFDHPSENLFERYDVERQFQKALQRKVWLKSGAYLIVEETEAFVVIDVNTGKFVGKDDQEDTIYQTNLEAAEAVADQLRLRDVGGIIVIDFIDMRRHENQRNLLKKVKELLKKDRAKTTVLPLTDYGLMQMTRKRVRESLSKTIFETCPYCKGIGHILTPSQVWKGMKYAILHHCEDHENQKTLQITLHPHLRKYLEEEMLETLRDMASETGRTFHFLDNPAYHIEQYDVTSA